MYEKQNKQRKTTRRKRKGVYGKVAGRVKEDVKKDEEGEVK